MPLGLRPDCDLDGVRRGTEGAGRLRGELTRGEFSTPWDSVRLAIVTDTTFEACRWTSAGLRSRLREVGREGGGCLGESWWRGGPYAGRGLSDAQLLGQPGHDRLRIVFHRLVLVAELRR